MVEAANVDDADVIKGRTCRRDEVDCRIENGGIEFDFIPTRIYSPQAQLQSDKIGEDAADDHNKDGDLDETAGCHVGGDGDGDIG